MSLITDRCKTIAGVIQVAKATSQKITQGGETFFWAPVGCADDQVEGLAVRGFKLMAYQGRLGLAWTKATNRMRVAA